MGISNDADNSATDFHQDVQDEESLPLYSSNFEFGEAATGNSLPDPTATPDEVRDYLVQLLTIQRRLPVDHARRAAARWTVGSGRELRSYSPAMYLSIFGAEDGWLLYKDVQVSVRAIKDAKKGLVKRHGAVLVAAFLLGWDLIMGGILAFGDSSWTGLMVFAVFGIMFGGFGLLMTLLITIIEHFNRKSPEELAEEELRKAFVNGQHSQPGTSPQ